MQQKLNKNGPFYSIFFLFNFVAFGCISLVSKDGNIYVLAKEAAVGWWAGKRQPTVASLVLARYVYLRTYIS